jgi:hypothetical protein
MKKIMVKEINEFERKKYKSLICFKKRKNLIWLKFKKKKKNNLFLLQKKQKKRKKTKDLQDFSVIL